MGLFDRKKENKVPETKVEAPETVNEVKAEAPANVKPAAPAPTPAPAARPVAKEAEQVVDPAMAKELKLFAEKCEKIFTEVKKDIIGQTEVVQSTIIDPLNLRIESFIVNELASMKG